MRHVVPKLVAPPNAVKSVKLTEMRDGAVAVIVKWGQHKAYLGRVVQRYGDRLLMLGSDSDHSWSNDIFKHPWAEAGLLRVRILAPGTYLKLVVDTVKGA